MSKACETEVVTIDVCGKIGDATLEGQFVGELRRPGIEPPPVEPPPTPDPDAPIAPLNFSGEWQ